MNDQPAAPSQEPTSSPSLWRQLAKRLVRLLVILLIVAAVAWTVLHFVAARTLKNEITEIRDTGRPLTLDGLAEAYPAVPEADDAAPLYKAAVALWRKDTHRKVETLWDKLQGLSGPTDAVPADLAERIEAVLADNALALEMVDRGAAKPGCAYDVNLSCGVEHGMTQSLAARGLAELVRVRTVYLARQGRASEAVQSLISGLRMMRMFDRQPVLEFWLTRGACASIHVSTVPAILEAGGLSDENLDALAAALRRVEPGINTVRVWEAEQVHKLAQFRHMAGIPEDLVPSGTMLLDAPPRGWWWVRPVFRMMVVRELALYDDVIAAVDKPWPEAFEAVQAIPDTGYGLFGLFCEVQVPGLKQAMALLGRTLGLVRSAQMAVEVERYRLARGELPETLTELEASLEVDLPADPFTGGPLVYKVTDDGYMVYTVSDDKADDGGPEAPDRPDFGVVIRR